MMNDKELEKYYEDLEYRTMNRRNCVQFILSITALLTSWIGFHFFNWHIVGTGLLFSLGIVLFFTGGFDYIKAQQTFQKVEDKHE